MPTVINNPLTFRPGLTVDQLTFREQSRPKERRSLPFSMVPQSVEGSLLKPDQFVLTFDYLIDEPPGTPPDLPLHDVVMTFGKFSAKLLTVKITFSEADDFFVKLESVRAYVEENNSQSKKAASRHYFTIVEGILRSVYADLKERGFPPSTALAA